MPHDILLKLSYSSPPASHTCKYNGPYTAINFEAYIVGCISIRAVELLNRSSLTTEVSSEDVLVCIPICMWDLPQFDFFKILSIYLCTSWENLSFVNEHFMKPCLILTCRLSGKQWVMLHTPQIQINLTYDNCIFSCLLEPFLKLKSPTIVAT